MGAYSTWRQRRGSRAILVLVGVALAVAVAPLALGATGQVVRAGLQSSATSESQIIGNVLTYATRQSNFNEGTGGAAAYGCRANAGTHPCLFAFNLRDGLAFLFRSRGLQAGTIMVDPPAGKTNADVAPFTTNANGIARGLNADRVDGKSATDFEAASAVRHLGLRKLAQGQSVALLTLGTLTLTGRCRLAGANRIAEVVLASTQSGTAYAARGGSSAALSAAQEGTLASVSQPVGMAGFANSGAASIVGADGMVVSGSVFAGTGVQASDCVVGGALTIG